MAAPQDPGMEIATKAATSLITDALKGAVGGLKRFDKWVGNKAIERDILGEAARAYAHRLEDRYNVMKVLGMSKPMPLRNIYVRVNILEKITEKRHASIEDLEKDFQRDSRRFGRVLIVRDGMQVVRTHRRLMVLGKPGAGKTTFLKHLLFQALDEKVPGNPLPLFISLKEWSDQGIELLNFIAGEFDRCGLPKALPWAKRLLERGQCLILLDGLDEVTANPEEALRRLIAFTDKYDANRIIISCRIAAYNYVFEHFTDVEMADFNDEQIEAFIKNFFGDEGQTGKQCWEKLQAHPPTKELASVPLLLTLLCIAFDEAYDFPANRADLYRQAIDTLLSKWDAKRRIKRQEVYQNLNLRRKENLLSQVAFRNFSESRYFIPQRVLERQIADYIENLPEVEDATLMPQSAAVLKAIEAQHGLLIRRAKTVYSFSHLTVQEYFTARFIVDHQHEGTLEMLVNDYVSDDTWREVILLTVGMLLDAERLARLIREWLKNFALQTKLVPWLKEVDALIKPDAPFPQPFCRCLGALYTLAHNLACAFAKDPNRALDLGLDLGLDRAREFAIEFEFGADYSQDLNLDPDLSLALARVGALDRARVKGGEFDLDRARILARDLVLALARELNLGLDLNLDRVRARALNLDRVLNLAHAYALEHETEINRALARYFYTCSLLLTCIGNSSYLPKQTRELLMNSLLLEPWSA